MNKVYKATPWHSDFPVCFFLSSFKVTYSTLSNSIILYTLNQLIPALHWSYYTWCLQDHINPCFLWLQRSIKLTYSKYLMYKFSQHSDGYIFDIFDISIVFKIKLCLCMNNVAAQHEFTAFKLLNFGIWLCFGSKTTWLGLRKHYGLG